MAETKYIQVKVSDETFIALVRMSSLTGQHPSDLAGQYIEDGLHTAVTTTDEMKSPDDPHLKVWAAYNTIRRAVTVRNQLRVIARSILSGGGDEVEIQHFQDMAGEVGVDPVSVWAEAQAEENISGGFIELDQGPASDARGFLLTLLADGRQVATTELKRKAKEAGISEASLKAARSDLNVIASNEGRQWYVRLPLQAQVPPPVRVQR